LSAAGAEVVPSIDGWLDELDLLSKLLDRHREEGAEKWRLANVEGLSAEDVYQKLMRVIDLLVQLQRDRR
jgi:hypothetical protein